MLDAPLASPRFPDAPGWNDDLEKDEGMSQSEPIAML
jgi:hypothetical protein